MEGLTERQKERGIVEGREEFDVITEWDYNAVSGFAARYDKILDLICSSVCGCLLLVCLSASWKLILQT